jgi:hypothetical protein
MRMLPAGRRLVPAANGRGKGLLPAAAALLLALAALACVPGAEAQESLCAQVKIEIRQELSGIDRVDGGRVAPATTAEYSLADHPRARRRGQHADR